MSLAAVKRELLVRYLDYWAATALHRARRATLALAGADQETAEAALRTLAEFTDLLRRRTLTVVLLAPTPPDLTALQRELDTPAELSVLPVAGNPADLLAPALSAAGPAAAPLLVYLDGGPLPAPPTLAAIRAGKPGELLLATSPDADWRAALHDAGFPLVTGVDLVADEATQLLVYATAAGRNLESFKNALWSVDEYAGIRYRDPRDPAGHLLDITLHPHPGPLRRELLARLSDVGPSTVTELRDYTLSETVYRTADAAGALAALLATGAVTRDPPSGRLSGDVTIHPT